MVFSGVMDWVWVASECICLLIKEADLGSDRGSPREAEDCTKERGDRTARALLIEAALCTGRSIWAEKRKGERFVD